ncbi:MAG: amino acid permease [Thermomicrobiales bacterium]
MATTVPVPSPPVSSGDTTAHPQVSKGGASISMITLAVMTVTTVVSLRGLPSQAEFGLSSIFFYVFAAVFFLIPFALVCAELASTFTKSGGIFRWCGEAFGPRWGFAAMFLEWETVVIWFPSVLIFAAVALAYTLWPASRDEALASNRWYTIVVLLIVYWAATQHLPRHQVRRQPEQVGRHHRHHHSGLRPDGARCALAAARQPKQSADG